MKSPKDPFVRHGEVSTNQSGSSVKKIRIEDVLKDLRAGLRTKGFLSKYGFTLPQFEELLKSLIRKGLFTKEEFRVWKTRRVEPEPSPAPPRPSPPPPPHSEEPSFDVEEVEPPPGEKSDHSISTYVIRNPERNNSWALQLFSTARERMNGAQFKVNLQGKKYSFVVEKMLFRGSVDMLSQGEGSDADRKKKREVALQNIAKHGWAAYLETRAFEANFGPEEEAEPSKKARLVLLHCRNETFFAALHTPAPAINLYVGSSLEKIRERLSKTVDTRGLGI